VEVVNAFGLFQVAVLNLPRASRVERIQAICALGRNWVAETLVEIFVYY